MTSAAENRGQPTSAGLRDHIEFLGARAPVALFRRLPFSMAYRMGELLGDLAYVLARPQRRVAERNLEIAFPEKSAVERSSIYRASLRNLGRVGAEFCHMRGLSRENVGEWVTFADRDGFLEQWNRFVGTTGAVAVTGHFGNWELFAHAVGLFGFPGPPPTLVYRPFRNPLFTDFVTSERARTGTRLVARREAGRDLVRAIRRDKGVVIIPFDQNATGRWGVFAEFFGLPASTHPGLAKIALLSRAPIFPVFLVRDGNRPRHQIELLPPIELPSTGNRDHDVIETLRLANRALELMIRRHPDHWIWMHKRWRTRPEGEPPIYD